MQKPVFWLAMTVIYKGFKINMDIWDNLVRWIFDNNIQVHNYKY